MRAFPPLWEQWAMRLESAARGAGKDVCGIAPLSLAVRIFVEGSTKVEPTSANASLCSTEIDRCLGEVGRARPDADGVRTKIERISAKVGWFRPHVGGRSPLLDHIRGKFDQMCPFDEM